MRNKVMGDRGEDTRGKSGKRVEPPRVSTCPRPRAHLEHHVLLARIPDVELSARSLPMRVCSAWSAEGEMGSVSWVGPFACENCQPFRALRVAHSRKTMHRAGENSVVRRVGSPRAAISSSRGKNQERAGAMCVRGGVGGRARTWKLELR